MITVIHKYVSDEMHIESEKVTPLFWNTNSRFPFPYGMIYKVTISGIPGEAMIRTTMITKLSGV